MPLIRTAIIDEIRHLDFPMGSYWLVMGAALVLYGVKGTTNDIDLGCTSDLFNTLIAKGSKLVFSNSGKDKIALGNCIHIYREWKVDNTVLIDGIPVADLNSVIHDKEMIGRAKDLEDIIAIRKFINEEKLRHG